METAVLIVVSYLVGSIPFGVIIAKRKGVDIMAVGSGNTGATNVTRILGWRLGVTVFVFDILKGIVPAAVALYVTGSEDTALVIGVVAVLGHMFSPFLKFKGGKGVATSVGALLGSVPVVGAITFGVFFLVFFLSRIISLSALVAAIAILVSGAVLAKSWVFFAVYGPLIVYVFVRHRSNIGRIIRGEEPKLDFKSKLGERDEEEDDDASV